MSEASGGATAMDTLERKFAIPEKSGEAGEADSPEQSGVQTPKHEYQSGFKRLRPTGWEEVEGSEHGTGSGEDDELPGTSVGSIEATADEVGYLQNRTKSRAPSSRTSSSSSAGRGAPSARRDPCPNFQKTSSKPRLFFQSRDRDPDPARHRPGFDPQTDPIVVLNLPGDGPLTRTPRRRESASCCSCCDPSRGAPVPLVHAKIILASRGGKNTQI